MSATHIQMQWRYDGDESVCFNHPHPNLFPSRPFPVQAFPRPAFPHPGRSCPTISPFWPLPVLTFSCLVSPVPAFLRPGLSPSRPFTIPAFPFPAFSSSRWSFQALGNKVKGVWAEETENQEEQVQEAQGRGIERLITKDIMGMLDNLHHDQYSHDVIHLTSNWILLLKCFWRSEQTTSQNLLRQQAPAVTAVAVTSKTHRSSTRWNRPGRYWAPFQNSCNTEPLSQPALEHISLRYNARWNTSVSVTTRVGTHQSPSQIVLQHVQPRYIVSLNRGLPVTVKIVTVTGAFQRRVRQWLAVTRISELRPISP